MICLSGSLAEPWDSTVSMTTDGVVGAETMYDIVPYHGWPSVAPLLLAPPDTAGATARSGTGDQVAIKSKITAGPPIPGAVATGVSMTRAQLAPRCT